VPFVKFARDKRGYEYIYLVHDSTRGSRSRSIVLYWYRTPPGVKVGRPPFDAEVRQRLEAQNPDIKFDWRAITSAQPPPPDAEHWRERRRAEKAAKLARLDDERAEHDGDADDETAAEADRRAERAPAPEAAVPIVEPSSVEHREAIASAGLAPNSQEGATTLEAPGRPRRRRRGRGRRQPPASHTHPESSPTDAGAAEGPDDSGPEEPGPS
jgi:hypothetical protein